MQSKTIHVKLITKKYIKRYFLLVNQKNEMTSRFKSLSIYNTMDSVFATILMALRGSTISFSLSFVRTQSGTNLETKDRVLNPTLSSYSVAQTRTELYTFIHILTLVQDGIYEVLLEQRNSHLLIGSFSV